MTRRNDKPGTDEVGDLRADELLESLRPKGPNLDAFARVRVALESGAPRPPSRPSWRRWRSLGGAGVVGLVVAALLFARWRSEPATGRTEKLPVQRSVIVGGTDRPAPRLSIVETPAGETPRLVPAGAQRQEPRDVAHGAVQKPAPHRHVRTSEASPPHPPVPHQPPVSPVEPDPEERVRDSQERIEAELLTGAIHALRRDRDPGRALMLLDFYRQRYPNGALTEESLALAIEAAEARHDRRASAYAQRYLARFPAGQYRDAAKRVAAGPSE